MIFNAIDKHLYTIIILHGMFQTNRDLMPLANNLQNYNHNIKVILPSAPKRNISWSSPQEINVSAWYDYYTRKDGWLEHDDINIQHFHEQTDRIYNIIDNSCITTEKRRFLWVADAPKKWQEIKDGTNLRD